MVDVVFYSAIIQPNGEVKLTKQDRHIDLNPSRNMVNIIIQDKPFIRRDPAHYDPTLTAFYEPKKGKS